MIVAQGERAKRSGTLGVGFSLIRKPALAGGRRLFPKFSDARFAGLLHSLGL